MTHKTTTALALLLATGLAGTASAEIRLGASLAATGPAAFLGDPEAKTLEMLVGAGERSGRRQRRRDRADPL